MTFGEKIRNLRIACKMTQEQLAAETGIAKRSIIIYESGQRPPKMEKIYEAFAEFFIPEYKQGDIEHKYADTYGNGKQGVCNERQPRKPAGHKAVRFYKHRNRAGIKSCAEQIAQRID